MRYESTGNSLWIRTFAHAVKPTLKSVLFELEHSAVDMSV